MKWDSPITAVKGVGAKTQELFANMGVYTAGDILLRFPRTYVQYPKAVSLSESSLLEGEHAAIKATLSKAASTRNNGRITVTTLNLSEGKKKLQLVWFRMPYLKNSLIPGKTAVFYGKITVKGGRLTMDQPVIYTPQQYEDLELCFLPVYSLPAKVHNSLLVKTVRQTLDSLELCSDFLPKGIRTEYELCEYNYALKQIHFPDTMDTLITARKRLVFNEFFLFIMGMQYQKQKRKQEPNRFVINRHDFAAELIQKLPYPLTKAQLHALADIQKDISGPYSMQRLIQGDVGSGKTIIAFLAMAETAACGYQSAIMAPTEVLARQHYETFCDLCRKFGLDIPVILLTGSMKAKEKRDAYLRMQLQKNAMVIGTHALIQEKAVYENLALVITDEQHRFGVRQRDTFSGKGNCPHIIVMSATPIPRTLAIILYGDMDISVIDEVPAKRLPIKNCVVPIGYRPKSYSFIEEQVRAGHQAYVICPLVEESENSEGENVCDYSGRLSEALPDIRVEMLHGKMKPDVKNRIMEQFAAGEIQVLVSTTVIEVGVNVPNATVMMIENADKFGLAQLHQLRGRVGRGDAQSYCIMINTSHNQDAAKRLEILNRSNDGFLIASEDLKLRGPGDFFGIRQSGELMFALADIYQDASVLQEAAEAAAGILETDPDLETEEHQLLKREMKHFEDISLKNLSL